MAAEASTPPVNPADRTMRAIVLPFLLTAFIPTALIVTGYLPILEKHAPTLALGVRIAGSGLLISLLWLLLVLATIAYAASIMGSHAAGITLDIDAFRMLGVLSGAATCVPASFIALLVLLPPVPAGSWLEPFDPVVWNQEKTSHLSITPRQRMIGDLTQRVLPGMTEIDITALLGKPDSEEYSGIGRQLTYLTGPARSGAIDDEWLEIEFTLDGLFDRYIVRED